MLSFLGVYDRPEGFAAFGVLFGVDLMSVSGAFW
jgi:hypothetical protein